MSIIVAKWSERFASAQICDAAPRALLVRVPVHPFAQLSGCGPQDRACGGDRSGAISRLSKHDRTSFQSQLATLFEAIAETEDRVESGLHDAVDV